MKGEQENMQVSKEKELLYKWISSLIVIALLLMFLSIPFFLAKVFAKEKEVEFGTSGKFQKEIITETAEEIMALLGEGAVEDILINYGAPETYSTSNVNTIMSEAEKIQQDWGTYQNGIVKRLFEVKLQGNYYGAVQILGNYENVPVHVHIYFDEDMKLSGIKFTKAEGG